MRACINHQPASPPFCTAGYAAYGYARSLPLFKASAKKRPARKAADAPPIVIDEDDWVKGTAYDQMRKRKEKSATAGKGKAAAAKQ